MKQLSAKICSNCKNLLPVSRFGKHKKAATGFQAWCKNCMNEYHRFNRLNNPNFRKGLEKTERNSRLLREYNISLAEFDEILDYQKNVCVICKLPCPTGKRLAVDHNHLTGEIRGLLCMPCNRMLGLIERHPDILGGLLNYLTEPNPIPKILEAFQNRPRTIEIKWSKFHGCCIRCGSIDKPHCGKGLCETCYYMDRYDLKHPGAKQKRISQKNK